MPRDIPVGNGQMLVTFDARYQIRDLYYPHVGQENHAGGGPCRFGVYAEIPPEHREGDRRRKRVFWTDDEGWDVSLKYQDDTLATDVTLRHDTLGLELRCEDIVDFHRPVLVRRVELVNHTDRDREVRLIHQQDFSMYGTRLGDTAYYDPQLRSLIHYRKQRYLMACFYAEGEQQVDEYATGTAGFRGAEGTWRDAEDGTLGNNPIAQGAVDSTILIHTQLPPDGSRVVYLIIGAGQTHEDLQELHRFLHRVSPQGSIDRTVAYWRLWLAATRTEFDVPAQTGLSERVHDLYKRSLLVVRSQIDNGGAIIAANDSDIMQFARDTYSYLWPRDGAFVADALDAAGFSDVVRQFFSFCTQTIEPGGYFQHKYNPDGSPASSWHPWVASGRPQLPIQEDETALVVWAVWRHYVRYRDIEFVRPLWIRLVQPAADFMCRYRDPDTGLPLPSYDLWEERWGVHAFTVATVHAGLKAAWKFAACFGDRDRARRYAEAAQGIQESFCKYLWSEEHGRFLRRVVPLDHDRTARFMAEVMAGRDPLSANADPLAGLPGSGNGNSNGNGKHTAEEIEFELDTNIDSSMSAIATLGLLPVDDERVAATMTAIEDRLWVKTDVGGMARYEDDYYHQVTKETDRVPGNPWFICTLWLAEYYILKAKRIEDLERPAEILEWVAAHALPSGVLAEQVHPETNAPLSVSPLTWSHATVVSVLVSYLDKLGRLSPTSKWGVDPLDGEGPTRAVIGRPVPDLTV